MEFNGTSPANALYPAIAAHRGWHQDGAPKNSIAGLELAVKNGADTVEIDVRRLLDGTIVVHHDATLPDGRRLADVDARVLNEYPHIPTLHAWGKRAGELGAHGLIELKESGYEQEVVDTLHRSIAPDKLEFFSFKAAAVRALSRIVPDRPVGLLSDLQSPAVAGAKLVQNARDAHATFVGLNVRQSSDDVLDAIRHARLGMKVWTVDTPGDLRRLMQSRSVDTIITDVPAMALKIRGDLNLVTTAQKLASTIR